MSAPSDTEWLAFSSGRSGDGDIYAIPPGSDVPEPLVVTEASEGTPRYDPGADRLVYSRFDSGGAVIMTGDSELFPDPKSPPTHQHRKKLGFRKGMPELSGNG